MRMPFGRHKNEELKDIPHSYLRWVLTCERIDPFLEEEIHRILGYHRRHESQSPPPPPPPSGRDARAILEKAKASVLDAVKRWHRKQSVRNHPDRGGDTRVMQAVNAVADDLVKDIQAVFDAVVRTT